MLSSAALPAHSTSDVKDRFKCAKSVTLVLLSKYGLSQIENTWTN